VKLTTDVHPVPR